MAQKRSTAYIVRVHRKDAGGVVPFDKVYLFHKRDEGIIPRVFKDAMVLPLSKKFSKALKEAVKTRVKDSKAFSFYRNNAAPVAALSQTVEAKLDKYNNYLAVVPVLFTATGRTPPSNRKNTKSPRTEKKQTFPAYLIAKPGTQYNVNAMRNALTARAYFLLGAKKTRPICLACPKHHDFIQGKCTPGQLVCYTMLAKATKSDLVRGVKRYNEWLANDSEPVLKLGGK